MKGTIASVSLTMLIILSLLLGGLITTATVVNTGELAFFPSNVSWVVGSEPVDKKISVQMNITDVASITGIVFSFSWNASLLNLTDVSFTPDCIFGTAGSPAPGGTGGTVIVPASWKTATHFSDGNFSQQSYSELPLFVPLTFSSPAQGKVVTLTFQYVGAVPSIGSPVDTEIFIVDNDYLLPGGYKMATKWVKQPGSVATIFNVLGSCHFHYETALKAVHLEAEEDTSVSTNLGTITFDGLSYTLPDDVPKTVGTYQAQYFADAGYLFDHWETSGLISIFDANANPATVTVSNDGSLKAIYRKVAATYAVRLESEIDIGASANLGTITFDEVSYNLSVNVSKTVGTYSAEYLADVCYMFYHWETTGMVSMTDANANPATVTVSGNGTLKVIYASHHIDHLHDDYVPMVIPVNDTNITIAPVITCTVFDDDVWNPFHYPCQLAQTTLIDDDWSNGDANYTYVFEDWVDYDWNDIVVILYAFTNDVITVELRIEDREAAWKNPFAVGITPMGMDVWVHWNSTDYLWEHIFRVNSSEPEDIELFCESNPGDNASITIIPIIPPTYTLTITSTSGGTTDPVPDSYSYDKWSVVPVTAIPDSGYAFDHWELDGVDVGSANLIDVTINTDHTLHAVFRSVVYFTLTITSTTGGATNPSPGTYSYEEGTVVSVEANPDTGYMFDWWLMDGGHAVVNNPLCVKMNENHTLHAVFKEPLPSPPVGGRALPIGKPHLLILEIGLTPRIGLASVLLAVVAAIVILIRQKKKTLRRDH